MSDTGPSGRLTGLALELLGPGATGSVTDAITAQAVSLVPGCDYAGISVVGVDRDITTVAATDDLVRAVDDWQYALDEGPCLDAIQYDETVTSQRLAEERRWPRWTGWVHDHLGINSMLCVQLVTFDDAYAGMTLYSRAADAFSSADEDIAVALSGHAVVALDSAHELQPLPGSLHNPTVVAWAQGMLMERYDITEVQAFQMLIRTSQREHREITAVAEELVSARRAQRRTET